MPTSDLTHLRHEVQEVKCIIVITQILVIGKILRETWVMQVRKAKRVKGGGGKRSEGSQGAGKQNQPHFQWWSDSEKGPQKSKANCAAKHTKHR